MANANHKFSDLEKGKDGGEQETAFNRETDESTRFLPADSNGDGKSKGPNGELIQEEGKSDADDFYGLTKEELERYASDPKWVKIRWILFGIFVVCWALMLIAAIVIVVLTPKCPPVPDLTWFHTGVAYKVDVGKFQDSDGNGIGDINGLSSRLPHFTDLNVKILWLPASFVDSSEMTKPAADYGTRDDFTAMTTKFKKQGVRVMLNIEVDAMNEDAADKFLRDWADAGVEGFVVDSVSSNKTSSLISRWQQILDDDFNKKDDRDRVVIGGPALVSDSPSIELPALVYSPPTPTECLTGAVVGQSEACDLALLKAAGVIGLTDPVTRWNVTQPASWNSALVDLVLRLTLPGTPNVLYGDEIGFTGDLDSRSQMYWDSETANVSSDADTVQAQKSVGYNQISYYNLFKELTAVRADSASLKWGNMTAKEATDVVMFVRKAVDFPPVLVAVNSKTEGYVADMTYGDYTQCKVLLSNADKISADDTFATSSVYLQPNSVLLCQLSIPKEK